MISYVKKENYSTCLWLHAFLWGHGPWLVTLEYWTPPPYEVDSSLVAVQAQVNLQDQTSNSCLGELMIIGGLCRSNVCSVTTTQSPTAFGMQGLANVLRWTKSTSHRAVICRSDTRRWDFFQPDSQPSLRLSVIVLLASQRSEQSRQVLKIFSSKSVKYQKLDSLGRNHIYVFLFFCCPSIILSWKIQTFFCVI